MSKLNFVIAYVMSAATTSKSDEKGATAVEYALVVAGIAIGLVVAVGAFGGALATFFNGLAADVGI
jgi:pilus assembly protein Flp/PilA